MTELSNDVIEPENSPPIKPPIKKIAIDSYPPKYVWVLMGFTILVFVGQMASNFLFGGDILVAYGLKHNASIINGEWWRFITPLFLHADILHIGMNMYFLYRLGPILEKFYGHYRFVLFYFVTAFTGVALDFVFSPNPSLGASTAMFGIYGATMVLYHRNAKVFGVQKKGITQSFINFLVINLIFGSMVNASIWGHAGGLLGGMMIAWIGGPIYGFTATETHLQFYDTRKPNQFEYAVLLTFMLFVMFIAIRFMSLRFF